MSSKRKRPSAPVTVRCGSSAPNRITFTLGIPAPVDAFTTRPSTICPARIAGMSKEAVSSARSIRLEDVRTAGRVTNILEKLLPGPECLRHFGIQFGQLFVKERILRIVAREVGQQFARIGVFLFAEVDD